jgi:hypothetical protein
MGTEPDEDGSPYANACGRENPSSPGVGLNAPGEREFD